MLKSRENFQPQCTQWKFHLCESQGWISPTVQVMQKSFFKSLGEFSLIMYGKKVLQQGTAKIKPAVGQNMAQVHERLHK